MWAKRKAAAKRQQKPRPWKWTPSLPTIPAEFEGPKEEAPLPTLPAEPRGTKEESPLLTLPARHRGTKEKPSLSTQPSSSVWIKRKRAMKRRQSKETKQAPSLPTLPAEIRVQILQYLLWDRNCVCPQPRMPKNLHPAVLRTSRTIYQEGAHILYEKNTFFYRFSANRYGGFERFDRVLQDENMARVKHLEMHFYSLRATLTAGCVSWALGSFSCWVTSLKTLRLSFNTDPHHGPRLTTLQRDSDPTDGKSVDLLCQPWQEENSRYVISEDISAFRVQKSIELCFYARFLDDTEQFGHFAQFVATRLGWSATMVEHTARDNSDWGDATHDGSSNGSSYNTSYHDYDYTWLWRLQPAI